MATNAIAVYTSSEVSNEFPGCCRSKTSHSNDMVYDLPCLAVTAAQKRKPESTIMTRKRRNARRLYAPIALPTQTQKWSYWSTQAPEMRQYLDRGGASPVTGHCRFGTCDPAPVEVALRFSMSSTLGIFAPLIAT